MPYALVPMVPNAAPGPRGITGTHPLSLDFGGNSVVLSDTLAIAWTPNEILDARVKTICDDKLDTLVPTRRAFLQNILPDRTVRSTDRFNDVIGNLLKSPPSGADWKPLTPYIDRGQLEVLLGPGGFLHPGGPGLLWSEPADVRGPHSQTLTDTFNRADAALGGSTSSDGLFTWSLVFGITAQNNVASNQAAITSVGPDNDMSLLASVAMDTADAYAWTDGLSLNGGQAYGGPFLRSIDGTLNVGDTGYRVEIDVGFSGIYNLINNANFASLDSVTTGGETTGSLYLQFVGSTYIFQRSGVTKLSGTNTTHAGGAGQRKVGLMGGAYDTPYSVTIDNFFAGDIVPSTQAPRSMHQFRLRR